MSVLTFSGKESGEVSQIDMTMDEIREQPSPKVGCRSGGPAQTLGEIRDKDSRLPHRAVRSVYVGRGVMGAGSGLQAGGWGLLF